MSLAPAMLAKPAFFDAIVLGERPPREPAAGGVSHLSTSMDEDPDLCPKPHPWPGPWLAEAVATLPSFGGVLGAKLTVGDGYCGNGSGPRPPLPLPHGII